ncbi:MAG TPA: HD domain-containing protein [Solirubrobacteraceae bacterium]|nr:HD domain-containing protein [Solirubrobacteraceae bacterium]
MSEALAVARAALAGEEVHLVGGAVRDRLLGRPLTDLDLVVAASDVAPAARVLGRAAGGPAFALSDLWGSWRVLAADRSWQADLTPRRGGSLEGDLALRDFTLNAMAEPLAGGARIDPHGGAEDLAAGRLRMVSERAFADDPLRAVRLARLSCELGLTVEQGTLAAARRYADGLHRVAGERIFAEFKRIVSADDALRGLDLLDRTGVVAVVLPELQAMRGVEQTVYHHRDVYGHVLEVFEHVIAIERDPASVLGEEHAEGVSALLAKPLSDELTRGGGLRLGALLHDVAKPVTQTPLARGGYGFPGHDELGARMSRNILTRLRTGERLRSHVAALARHHLRTGFLVHDRPLDRRALHAYLVACDPVAADVTLLSVADRLATRGRKAQEAIDRHLALVRELLPDVLRWQEEGPPAPLVRGDEVTRALDRPPGPWLGDTLAELAQAQYAGEITTREEALARVERGVPPRSRPS